MGLALQMADPPSAEALGYFQRALERGVVLKC
jgi:hypothetical protein